MSTAREHQRQQVAAVAARYAKVFCWLLDRFAAAVSNTTPDSHHKGMAWQSEFAAIARGKGLCVEAGIGRADWLTAGKRVQCKNIDSLRGGVIDISNMRPVKANDGHRGYLAHELDVLALMHLGEVFLIPRDAICDGSGVVAGRVSPSFIRQFRNNWAVFDAEYKPEPRARQQTFFETRSE